MAQLTFDATQYNPELGATGLPVGRHLVIIESDEVKKAKESDGGYLQFNLKCVHGEAVNMGAPYRLNLYNSNPKTVEIASRQLSAVCYAVGILGIQGDTSVLFNLPFMVDVALQKGDEAKEKGYTEIIRVLTASGEEIKAGMQPGGSKQNSQGQGGSFGGNQQQQSNNGFAQQNTQQQNGNGFGQQNHNQQQQDNSQQQNQNTGNVNFGQQNQNNNQQQNGNGNGQQWTPGQGQQQGGQQWTPRTN